jgi:glucosamine--fructose-6-phosphate aminotransferase (isomerizing)
VCSIIGYLGKTIAAPVIVDSLRKMEYRGYDSVGVATINCGKILIKKGKGKVDEVNTSLNLNSLPGQIGIGHTRWATHGGVTDGNAHPHSDCIGQIAVVHNGIIENYKALKDTLEEEGHKFRSQTDSEVIAHLLEYHYNISKDVKESMIKTCKKLEGTFAFVAIFEDGTIAGARYDEPLIVGLSNEGYFLSSDVLGFLKYTDKAIFLDNYDIVIANENGISLYNKYGSPVNRPLTQVAWEMAAVDKGNYAHHTLKEIHEQSRSILRALTLTTRSLDSFSNILASSKRLYLTGSGTSYHSALVAKYILARYAKIHSETILSSEFQRLQMFFNLLKWRKKWAQRYFLLLMFPHHLLQGPATLL